MTTLALLMQTQGIQDQLVAVLTQFYGDQVPTEILMVSMIQDAPEKVAGKQVQLLCYRKGQWLTTDVVQAEEVQWTRLKRTDFVRIVL